MPKDQFAHEGPWSVDVNPDAASSLSFDDLMARAHEAARSGDLDAWADREAQKVLAEMRSTTIEGRDVIQVYRIPIPKDSLLKLPKEERVCLLQLGHMANQVLMFEKLLIFATALDSKDEVEQYTTGVQTQMLVRLAVSAVFESLLVVERLFIKSKIGNDYKDKLDEKGSDALAYLKKLMGRSALLAAVRNNYGFHYPKADETEEAFQAAIADADFDGMWKVYFSHHGFNSMFLFCDVISTKGIAVEAGVADLAALQKQLMTELREAALNLVDFAHSFFAAIWVQHFGKEIDAEGITEITGAPKFDEVSIPFFVEV